MKNAQKMVMNKRVRETSALNKKFLFVFSFFTVIVYFFLQKFWSSFMTKTNSVDTQNCEYPRGPTHIYLASELTHSMWCILHKQCATNYHVSKRAHAWHEILLVWSLQNSWSVLYTDTNEILEALWEIFDSRFGLNKYAMLTYMVRQERRCFVS